MLKRHQATLRLRAVCLKGFRRQRCLDQIARADHDKDAPVTGICPLDLTDLNVQSIIPPTRKSILSYERLRHKCLWEASKSKLLTISSLARIPLVHVLCNLSLDGTDFLVRSYLKKSSPLTHCQGPKFRGVDLRGVDVHGLKESSGCSPRSEKDKDYKPSVRNLRRLLHQADHRNRNLLQSPLALGLPNDSVCSQVSLLY